ncbi:MAG TPA: HAMP domain-containing sensor histidine kinase [Chitinophagales bacterium]|nr:HAMP domain-containing sensor histidine kinase [Chitinophagales bacterium]HMV03330.1 HAMP domain-containing sensor histidine kinase [Chitinophagales bacterium]HMY43427.1 HAMP domain-containing sensor histidine kinase [Chitinophagales bacterium]HMZ69571.1 HAMP domain-containing sensor histidine kinase [Chitinophagales bacterium]HNB39088.1 HAMP domain-containing sensor histidine kinase [Chitinophagales bacterium]
MRTNVIRNIIILAFISLGGIIVTQVFWVKKNLDYKNEKFNDNANIATRNAINKIVIQTNMDDLYYKMEQDTTGEFNIFFSKPFPLKNFEASLYKEYKENNIKTTITYIIRDFNHTQIKKGMIDLVNPKFKPEIFEFESIVQNIELNLDKNQSILLEPDIKLLAFFSFVLLVVLGFFSYTTIVIMREKQLSKVKTDFVNNMTHEFKTPIATIGLASTVLMKEDIYKMPEKLHHYATIINEENERLKKQVESVLQSSQIESKKIKLNVTAIDMHQLIAEITKNFEPRIKEHEGNLTTKKEATDFMIKGDIVHIKNILFNLLDNGIKYANKIPQIIVHTKNEKNYFVVSIHDNGKGISNDDKKKIFDKFYRVPSGNIHDVKGFGLGLFYVKDMMEQHKGFVSLKSTVDVGSTFSLWFPINKK